MTKRLHLIITTPVEVLLDDPAVQAVRAADESGSFGILPNHADFLTTLPASVVRWRRSDGTLHFCALRAGVLSVTGGDRVAIACREGILGDDLPLLEKRVIALRTSEQESDRQQRVEQMRLHASAVRQIMRFLNAGRPGAFDHPPAVPANTESGAP